MPRASATHTKPNMCTQWLSAALQWQRRVADVWENLPWVLRKCGGGGLWNGPLQDENCNDSEYSALNYCLFTLPSSQPLTSPITHPQPHFLRSHPSPPSLSATHTYTRRNLKLSQREWGKKKTKKPFEGWNFTQNTKGMESEWVEVQVAEYRGRAATAFSL